MQAQRFLFGRESPVENRRDLLEAASVSSGLGTIEPEWIMRDRFTCVLMTSCARSATVRRCAGFVRLRCGAGGRARPVDQPVRSCLSDRIATVWQRQWGSQDRSRDKVARRCNDRRTL